MSIKSSFQAPSRRRFLQMVGGAGGVSAVYATMQAMGLLHPPVSARPPDLPRGSGSGQSVVIVGAGLAGLTAAYELSQAGYDCTVLEAQERAGGRTWTVRSGDIITEDDSSQTCTFETGADFYFNPGPARIPYHHENVLGYCKKFGVPLQTFINDNRGAYFHNDEAFGGQRILNRQVTHTVRGYLAELLAKAINADALDEAIDADDKERVLAMVRNFGDLNSDFEYTGSGRAGYTVSPGAAAQAGELSPKLEMAELLKSDFWGFKLHFPEGWHQAATMLEPVGGMDQIAAGFVRQIGDLITYNASVQEIRKTPQGVRVLYALEGETRELEADYAIVTVPLSVLAQIPNDFSPAHQAAMEEVSYVKAVKIAFQSKRRFWEEDDNIYGGISWTDRDITQIWYPSSGFHQDKGILVGAYIWSNDIGERVGSLSLADRLELAIADGEKLHPGYRGELEVETGLSIAWHKVPYIRGGWASWSTEARAQAYPILNEPDDRLILAGEHLSYLTGWQEGAILSAHEAVRHISARTVAERS
ncbi:MAG: flavin monoamine oxidase family protein [Thermostichus sp. HHBFW_bins_43]